MCAGVIVKHVLDGSVGPLEPGQSPAEAAHDAHMAFAEYLASHSLSLDVWDGDSLLQVSLAVGVSVSKRVCMRACVTNDVLRMGFAWSGVCMVGCMPCRRTPVWPGHRGPIAAVAAQDACCPQPASSCSAFRNMDTPCPHQDKVGNTHMCTHNHAEQISAPHG